MAAEAPANPQTGDAWYDTTNKVLKIYDGSAWALAMPNRVYVSASDPSTTITGVVDGDIWFDASKNTLYVRVNGAWVADTTRVNVGTAPAAPVRGDIYWNSAEGCLKIYDGTAWQTVASYNITVKQDGNKAKVVFSAPGKADQEVAFVPGDNVSIGADAAKKEITISAKDTKYRMSASGDAAHSNENPHPSAKITHQEVGTETKEEVTIKGTGIADVTYDANTINIQVGRYRIEAVEQEGINGAILKLVQDRDEQAPAGGTSFQVPVLGGNGITVTKTAVGSNSQITIEGTTYTLSSVKNGDAIEIVLTDNKGATTKGTIKVGQGLAVDAAEDGTLTLKSTIKVPAYTTSVAARGAGGATINLNKEGESSPVGTVNIIAGENSTVTVDEKKNIVVASKDTTYGISAAVAGGVATITLTDNLDNTKSSTVKIGQGDNVTLTVEGGVIKIKAVDTVYTVGKVAENNGVTVKLTDNKDTPTSQDVAFVPGDNVSISLNTNKAVVIGVNTVSTINNETANNTIPNVGAIKKYVEGGIAASDAMVFRGTIGAADKNPTVTKLPENPGVGDTYKVVSDDTYGTLAARVGDIIIYAEGGWVLVPSGDDGNVYHAADLELDQLVVGAGTATVKTLPAGANNQILRMKDGKAAWTNETPESTLKLGDKKTDTNAGTTVVTDIDVAGHTITAKVKDIVGDNKDIKVTGESDKIKVSVKYTKNNVVTDLNADTDVLILNGGTASTVL